MSIEREIVRGPRLGYAVVAAAFGLCAWAAAPSPADARVFVGIGLGVPFPGYYPYPYYPYPYAPPPPYYYPPPPAAYYPPPAAGPAPVAAPAAASITYTERPAFKNASGQTCREVRYASGGLGTACQDAGGQWRISP